METVDVVLIIAAAAAPAAMLAIGWLLGREAGRQEAERSFSYERASLYAKLARLTNELNQLKARDEVLYAEVIDD